MRNKAGQSKRRAYPPPSAPLQGNLAINCASVEAWRSQSRGRAPLASLQFCGQLKSPISSICFSLTDAPCGSCADHMHTVTCYSVQPSLIHSLALQKISRYTASASAADLTDVLLQNWRSGQLSRTVQNIVGQYPKWANGCWFVSQIIWGYF